MGDRISSAVSFLQDATVASAPLPQRIDFLKSKGLSEAEIEQALAQVAQPLQRPSYAGFAGQQQYQQRQSDWRDWMWMSIVGGGTAYLVSQIAKRYLYPALSPPDANQLQQAQAALEAKYDEAAALLQELRNDSEAVKASMESQTTKVDGAVDQVTQALEAFQVKERERDEEFQKAKEEIDSLRELFNKASERQSKDQASSMSDIQTELKSLKSLLGSQQQQQPSRSGGRSPAPPSSESSTPSAADPPKFGITSFSSGKGGLPAWQLAGHQRLNQINGTGTSSAGAAAGSGEPEKAETPAEDAGTPEAQTEAREADAS